MAEGLLDSEEFRWDVFGPSQFTVGGDECGMFSFGEG